MAKQVLCANNHYYDPDRFASCPYCGVPDLKDIETKPYDAVQQKRPAAEHRADPDGKTKAYVPEGEKDKRFQPVVGWLVCIEGKERGRDYRIQPERNFIGRDPGMDIVVQGDDEISRDKHAEINYEPRSKRFFLNRGPDTSKNTYLNNDAVLTPMEIRSGDLIEVGQTKLLFVPFCGVYHNWFEKPARSEGKERPEPPKPRRQEDKPEPQKGTEPAEPPKDEPNRTMVQDGPWKPLRPDSDT